MNWDLPELIISAVRRGFLTDQEIAQTAKEIMQLEFMIQNEWAGGDAFEDCYAHDTDEVVSQAQDSWPNADIGSAMQYEVDRLVKRLE